MVSLGPMEAMLGCISKRDWWFPEFGEFRSLAFKGNCDGAVGAHRFIGNFVFGNR